MANLTEVINNLPLGVKTKIGANEMQLSGGEKQRILIARAIYKNPKILFFDEATSSLDTINEKKIMEKLNLFFKERTVIIIAHRLSTIRNADQILVLDKGKIIESGVHKSLISRKGSYYKLVQNQLHEEN